jgi:hypothetical protein
MDHIAGIVDAIIALADDIAVQIDLHKAGGGDFVKGEAERVDQEMMIRPRHTRGDMGVEEIIIIIDGRDTVESRQIDAGLPFGIGYAAGACIGHATF